MCRSGRAFPPFLAVLAYWRRTLCNVSLRFAGGIPLAYCVGGSRGGAGDVSAMRGRASTGAPLHAMGPGGLNLDVPGLPVREARREHPTQPPRGTEPMIKLALLFLTTGIALVVAVALIVGVAWIAVAIPVILVTGTGYGALALNRRWARSTDLATKTPRV